MNGDLIHFLVPSWGSALELTFFFLIIGSMLASLISAEISGRESTWEHNWKGGAHKGALDLEHGSISELSHALASLPERIVGNMPGLLLIFGLLGTFLGLGMALDKASGVLQGSSDSLNAMSDSLSQLTGMMKDLGSKFKTSTWGIIAFITLKLWEASRWSAESRRTDWCVRQMKWEMDLLRRRQREYSDARDHQAREVLEVVGERLVQAMGEQSQLLASEFKGLKLLDVQLAKQAQGQHEELISQLQVLGKQIEQSNRSLTRLDERAASTLEALGQQNTARAEQAGALNDHLDTLSGLAREGNRSLNSLEQHSEAAGRQLDELTSLHTQMADNTQERYSLLIEQLSEIASQTQESNLSVATIDKHIESSLQQLEQLAWLATQQAQQAQVRHEGLGSQLGEAFSHNLKLLEQLRDGLAPPPANAQAVPEKPARSARASGKPTQTPPETTEPA